MEQSQNTPVSWAHRRLDSHTNSRAALALNDRTKISSLGLSLRPNRRNKAVIRSEDPAQMQSPTVPRGLFVGDSPTTMGPVLSLEQTLSTLAASLEPPKRGSYTLNPAFMRSWEENNPPVPKLPKIPGGSFPVRIRAPLPTEKPISFPRSDDEPQLIRCATAVAAPSHNELLPPPPLPVTMQVSPSAPPLPSTIHPAPSAPQMPSTQPTLNAPPAMRSSPSERIISRNPSIRKQTALYPKRNYSLPAALMPVLPKLKLESYEFTSIESLERKWEETKTETTRLLSSAIYNYYFSHGEWTEFEQVFPGKVLESWVEFHSKLTPSELAFVNTVLVSQNPFSCVQNGQEKHIPVLARTIPLLQAVRTMVLSEDVRSRESCSAQGGFEIDLEFADWLVTRFNSKKMSMAVSPFDKVQDGSQLDRIEDVTQPEKTEASSSEKEQNAELSENVEISQPEQIQETPQPEQTQEAPLPNHSVQKTPSPPPVPQQSTPQQTVPQQTVPQQTVPQQTVPQQTAPQQTVPAPVQQRPIVPKPAMQELNVPEPKVPVAETAPNPAEAPPAHKSLGLWTSPETKHTALNPKRSNTFMGIEMRNASVDEMAKPRRNLFSGRKSEDVPKQSMRRPTINIPSVFHAWRKPSTKAVPSALDDLINLPPSPKQKRPDTAARPSSSKSRRHTHNFFASSSNEVDSRASLDSSRSARRVTRDIQMKDLPPLPPNAHEISQLSRIGAEARIKATQSANVLRKGSSMLTHFSSHSELGQRMAAAFDKPRASSVTTDNPEQGRRKPSISMSPLRDSTSSKGSRPRESGSTEIVPMVYEWRPAPQHGDCNWGFAISSLALKQPAGRKKSNAAMFVVNSHTPTMNRRGLPEPQKPVDAPYKSQKPVDAARNVQKPVDVPNNVQKPVDVPNNLQKPVDAPHKPTDMPRVSQSVPESRQMPGQSSPESSKDQALHLVPPKLPTARMPQSQLGLPSTHNAKPASEMSGVRGVLYELAYLSTQSKSVWSKSDHIFANLSKSGLEVNRIAEQDFFDFCVDELLKYSNDASQDLEAMGNKKMAKKLYESFNAKLSILLTEAVL
ncbi:hypothetical protein J3F82_004232 [Coemansia sp. RSA 637]|nr:hypothetical protein J3F82_004232 [Coemansia sp. RSA 637]